MKLKEIYFIRFNISVSQTTVCNSYPSFGFGHATLIASPNVGILLTMQAYHWDSSNGVLRLAVSYTSLHCNYDQLSFHRCFPRNIVSEHYDTFFNTSLTRKIRVIHLHICAQILCTLLFRRLGHHLLFVRNITQICFAIP